MNVDAQNNFFTQSTLSRQTILYRQTVNYPNAINVGSTSTWPVLLVNWPVLLAELDWMRQNKSDTFGERYMCRKATSHIGVRVVKSTSSIT